MFSQFCSVLAEALAFFGQVSFRPRAFLLAALRARPLSVYDV